MGWTSAWGLTLTHSAVPTHTEPCPTPRHRSGLPQDNFQSWLPYKPAEGKTLSDALIWKKAAAFQCFASRYPEKKVLFFWKSAPRRRRNRELKEEEEVDFIARRSDFFWDEWVFDVGGCLSAFSRQSLNTIQKEEQENPANNLLLLWITFTHQPVYDYRKRVHEGTTLKSPIQEE